MTFAREYYLRHSMVPETLEKPYDSNYRFHYKFFSRHMVFALLNQTSYDVPYACIGWTTSIEGNLYGFLLS
jgi:hypothetical protein